MEYIELNWLCKHKKKVRSNRPCISKNSCTEVRVKHSFPLWVSLRTKIRRILSASNMFTLLTCIISKNNVIVAIKFTCQP